MDGLQIFRGSLCVKSFVVKFWHGAAAGATSNKGANDCALDCKI